MGRFATTTFTEKQRFNIVATLIQMVATLFQHCNAVLRKKNRPCKSFHVMPPLTKLLVSVILSQGNFSNGID